MVALGVVILDLGCSSTPIAPSTADVSGNWGGTTCPPAHYDSCVIDFAISQTGASLSGTYGTTSDHGTLTGAVSGSAVSLVLTSLALPATACSVRVGATVSGNQMTGTLGCVDGGGPSRPIKHVAFEMSHFARRTVTQRA